MPILPFISDDNLLLAVRDLFERGMKKQSNASKEFHKNVVDPFGAIIVSSIFNLNHDEWIKAEVSRQSMKTVSDKVGLFHQKIIGGVTGWEDLRVGRGLDVVNNAQKIIAEVKNKHNTTKGSDQIAVYDAIYESIAPNVSKYKGYTGYYVTIIPKKSERYDKCFTPSDNKTSQKRAANENIRHVDGATFYKIVTGYPNALDMLYKSLPKAIEETVNKHFREEYSLNDDDKYVVKEFERFTNYFNKAFK